VTAKRLDGTATAAAIRQEVAQGVVALRRDSGLTPGLTVVLVGERPASMAYVRGKERAAGEAGMRSEILPAGVDTHRVLEAIDPAKDVDGFHPINAGRLLLGLPGVLPATPAGVVALLKRHAIPLDGKRAVVLGRSNIVGKPMALLLLRENCTVTIAHSRTDGVAAIGRPGFVRGTFIKPGATVVDVGIHAITDEVQARALFAEDAAKLRALRDKGSVLCGDVHPREAAERAGWLSPVPGGVGPMTIAMLLVNTLEAARRCSASA
jgi:methylenetetrahydrofolate dehydrogenase (NADP+)/methenyltetrahydrofolate cyclohydrolase